MQYKTLETSNLTQSNITNKVGYMMILPFHSVKYFDRYITQEVGRIPVQADHYIPAYEKSCSCHVPSRIVLVINIQDCIKVMTCTLGFGDRSN